MVMVNHYLCSQNHDADNDNCICGYGSGGCDLIPQSLYYFTEVKIRNDEREGGGTFMELLMFCYELPL